VDDGTSANVPFGHAEQLGAPVYVVNVPLGHDKHDVLVGVGIYCPAKHLPGAEHPVRHM
jgi:hypothetical protein